MFRWRLVLLRFCFRWAWGANWWEFARWCKDVAEVGSRPAVGDCWKLDMQEVMRLRPSILIGSVPFAAETVQKILAEPVAFLAINPRSLADIYY